MAALDPVLHQETRLRIVAMLHRNREVAFAALREALGLTEGNLGGHIKRLTDSGYVRQRHALLGRRFEGRYSLTAAGSQALLAYLETLRAILPTWDDGRGPADDGARPASA